MCDPLKKEELMEVEQEMRLEKYSCMQGAFQVLFVIVDRYGKEDSGWSLNQNKRFDSQSSDQKFLTSCVISNVCVNKSMRSKVQF